MDIIVSDNMFSVSNYFFWAFNCQEKYPSFFLKLSLFASLPVSWLFIGIVVINYYFC